MRNKIGWCTMTFNPCWGCLNHCEYCYARKIAKRFWNQMYLNEFNYYYKKHPSWVWTGDPFIGLADFKPTFLESQFNKKFPKKPQRIFIGSMSEIYYWREEWIKKVIEKVKQYPQHTFIFLTKFPLIYSKYKFPDNCWLGVTITRQDEIHYNWSSFFNVPNRKNIKFFFSFEPLLGSINLSFYLDINWVILGAETGNRKGKIIPRKEWIENIVNYCRDNDIPVYLKDSLKDIYPVEIKEFPEVK